MENLNTNNDSLLRLEYVPISQAIKWEWVRNPKEHDIGALVTAIWKYGFQDPSKYDSALGAFVYGNGRVFAVKAGFDELRDAPPGIAFHLDSGEWHIPVVFGNDLKSREIAQAFAVDHNNLTMAGGDFDAVDMAKMWRLADYVKLLVEIGNAGEEAVTVDGEDTDDLLRYLASFTEDYSDLDQQVADLDGCQEVDIMITVAQKFESQVREWLANGEAQTSPGLGKGVLKRCGL